MFKKFLTSVFALILSISMINSNPGVISANNDNEPPIKTGGVQRIDADNLHWTPVSLENPLGGLDDFSAIVFDTFEEFHETAAPVAAKSIKNVSIITFRQGPPMAINQYLDIAIPHFNVAVLSQDLIEGPEIEVVNGDALISNDIYKNKIDISSEIDGSGNVFVNKPNVDKFMNDAQTDLENLNQTLWNLEANAPPVIASGNSINLDAGNSENNVHIFDVDLTSSGAKSLILDNFSKTDTMIIKVTGDSVQLNSTYLNGQQIVYANIDEFANRIIWVVDPNQDTFTVKSMIDGYVIAPSTNVLMTGGNASINGALVAKSFTGNGIGGGQEFHYVGRFKGSTTTEKKTTNISIDKKWNIDGKELTSDDSLNITESITVNLLANGVKVDDVLLNNMNNWSFVFSELPIKDDNGNDITYTFEEAGTTYDAIITGSAEDGFTITNNVKLETINIPVEKVWFGTELDNIEIQLLQNDKSFGEPIELSKSTNWKAEFNNLPKTDEYLNEYEYTVKELEVPGYYSEITEDESGGFIVTNIEKTSISVTKEWRGGYGDIESIDVSLVGGDSDQVITLNAPDFKGVFTDLPKYNKDGNPIEYKIEEVDVPEGYTPEYNWLNDKELVIKNNRTLKTEVSVSKTWIGKSLDSIVVVLYADGKEIDDVTLSAANSWNHTFKDLPYYNLEDSSQDGLAIDYTIQEYILDEKGNREELSDKLYNQKVIKVYDKESQTYKFDITNEFIVQTTNLPYKKIWQGEVIDGQEITVQVTQIDSTGIETILEDMTQTLTYPVTEGVFENLPMSDADGNPYLYTISELAVDGYASKIKVVDDITTITNTRSAVQNLHFKKIWETKEEASIVLNVYRESTGSEKQLYKTLNINGIKDGWSATLIDVPVFDTLGNPYTYSVEEAVDESYQSSVNRIEMDNDIKFEITNKFVSKTTTFDVTKKWNGEILEGLETIQVQLIRTSTNPDDKSVKEYEPITLSKENKWKATFPREYETHDPYGFEYEYEVKELLPEGYEDSYTVSIFETDNGFEITNTRSGVLDISVSKEWIGSDGNKSDVTVYLYQNGKLINNQNIVSYIDGDVKVWPVIKFENLPEFDEFGKAYTYTVDEEKLENFELVEPIEREENHFTLVNKDISTVDYLVKKVWVGGAEEKPEIKFSLYQNGLQYGDTITFEKGQLEYTFKNLPKYDKNGGLYKYTVTEINSIMRDTDVYISSADETEYSTIFTNTYQPKLVDVNVVKTWKEEGISTSDKVITLRLKSTQPLQEYVIKLDASDNYEGSFKAIPYTDMNGNVIEYYLTEDSIPGYRVEVEDFDSILKDLKVTNIRTENLSFEVTKEWIGFKPEDAKIVFELFRNGELLGEYTLDQSNNFSKIFENYSGFDENGDAYRYSVKETSLTGNKDGEPVELQDYNVAYLGNTNDGFKIVNSYKEVVIPLTTVVKEWVGGDASFRPDVTIQLIRTTNKTIEDIIDTVTLTNGTDYKYEWANLPQMSINGDTFEYRVREISKHENYEVIYENIENDFKITNKFTPEKTSYSVHKTWVDGPGAVDIELKLWQRLGVDEAIVYKEGKLLKGESVFIFSDLPKTDDDSNPYYYYVEEVVPDGYTPSYEHKDNSTSITNTFNLGSVDITANKVWVNGPEIKPSIQLQLYVGDVARGNPITLQNGQLSYTWSNLPETDYKGETLIYTVKELPVDGYTTTYDVTEETTTITNTFVVEETEYTANKVWIGGPDVKPTIKLQLLQNNIDYGDVVTLENGILSHTWTKLPVTDLEGNKYVYDVKEVDVPVGFHMTKTGKTITNTFIIEKVSITGTKIWEGGSERPEIELQLFQGENKLFDPVKLSLNNNDDRNTWKYTWNELDKTDINGNEHDYSVREVNVPDGYTSENRDDLTIINTFVIEKTDVVGTKKWVGGTSRPDIEIQLYRNDIACLDPVTLVSGEDTVRWKDLDLTDEDGNPYSYTIKEVNVPKEYVSTVSEDGLTITNTFKIEKRDFTVTKTWVDGPKIHPTIELQLYRNGEAYRQSVKLHDQEETYTWTDLDKTDIDGNEYIYTVDEINQSDDYDKEISSDGKIITNTFRVKEISFSIEKVWVNGPEVKPEITIELYRTNLITGEVEKVRTKHLQNGELTHVFENLNATNDIGESYEYFIKELEVENYDSEIEGGTITNTYVSEKTSIAGTKTWIGGPEVKPEITIALLQDGTIIDSVTLKDGELNYEFTDLDVTDINGNPYTYEVKEFEVADYESEKDGFNFTNTYVSEKTSIAGTKTWIGGPEVKPEITIALLQDGTIIDSVTLKDGELNYEFTDLDVTDVDGKPYTYDVKELEVEDYESVKDGFNFTNTFNEDSVFTEKTSVSIEKIWVGTALEKIEVFLHANNEIIDSVILSEETDWKHTFNLLELKDENEELIVYSISEAVYEEYTTDITEEDQIFIIVNTLIEEPEEPGDGDKPEEPGDGDKPEEPGDGDKPEEPSDGDKPGESGDSQVDSAIKQDGEEKLPSTGSFAILPNLGTASIVLSSLFWLFGKLRKEEEEEK